MRNKKYYPWASDRRKEALFLCIVTPEQVNLRLIACRGEKEEDVQGHTSGPT